MPYIEEKKRPQFDPIVDAMVEAGVKADGDLNYILFKYFKYYIPRNYNSIKNYCGELNECAKEIRRRFLIDYEDDKIFENGDV